LLKKNVIYLIRTESRCGVVDGLHDNNYALQRN